MFNTKTSQKSRFPRPRRLKKFLLFIVLPLVLLGAVLIVLEKTGVTNFYTKDSTPEQETTETINYEPPSEDEKQAGDEQKDKAMAEEEARNNNPSQGSQTAHVIITDAGQYDSVIEVRAFIPDHYQDGTCTITFTKDSLKVSKETPAYRDVSTTICTNPNFNRSEFAASGDWQVVVSYTSAGATGQSSPQNVTIK